MPKTIHEILIVDDEEDILAMLKDFLEENDFSVSTTTDGLTAQELLEKHLPDMVITDLLLPGEHGITLAKTIKEKYFLPVIIMSGIYQKEEVEDMMEQYFVEGFCEKPINLPDLLAIVNGINDKRQKD